MMLLVATVWADTGDTGEAADEPVVCGAIVAEPASCAEGEVIELSVDCEGNGTLTYSWTDDGGSSFADDAAPSTPWTCPGVECPARDVTVYATVLDPSGHQAWAFTQVRVTCVPDDDEDEDEHEDQAGMGAADRCGCGALGPLALGAPFFGFGRRRRQGPVPGQTAGE